MIQDFFHLSVYYTARPVGDNEITTFFWDHHTETEGFGSLFWNPFSTYTLISYSLGPVFRATRGSEHLMST